MKKRKIIAQTSKSTTVDTEVLPAMSLDPYKFEHRRAMIQNERVRTYLAQRSDAVRFHACKLPILPCQVAPRRKLKKPVKLKLYPSFEAEVTGHLGSGAFAHVFSVTSKTMDCDLEQASSMALKVSACVCAYARNAIVDTWV